MLTGLSLVWGIAFAIDARASAAPLDKTSDSIVEGGRDGVLTEADEARLASASHDPRRFATILRELIERVRARAIPGVEQKMMRRDAHEHAWVAGGIACASLLAFPYAIAAARGRRGGARMATPFGYRALAAGLIFFGMNLLAGTLLATDRLQALAGRGASPDRTAMSTTLDALDDGAEATTTLGPAVVTPPLTSLGRGEIAPLPSSFLGEVGRHAEGYAPTFDAVSTLARVLDAGARHAPALFVVLVVLVFVAALRPTLREILEMPARASSDEAHVAAAVRKSVLLRVARELVVTVVLAAKTVALGFAVAVAVSAVIRPATRVLLHYTLTAGGWTKTPGEASPLVLFAGLSAGIVFVVLAVILVLVACAAFVDKTHRLLQQRAHERATAPSHTTFWTWAPCGLAAVLVLPAAFGHAIAIFVEGPLDRALESGVLGPTSFFVAAPLVLVAGFLIVFWAARGFRTIGFVVGHALRPEVTPDTARSASITPPPMPAPIETPAAAAPIPVRARYSGPPQLVTTLPSASSAPPPPLEGSTSGPLSTTTPSAIAPSEIVQKQKPR